MTAPATLLAGVRNVAVGTRNEPKLAAVREAVAAYAPNARVEGVAVESGVPEQPVGFDEIVLGARNRAARAARARGAELGIGIEDGLVSLPSGGPGALQHINLGCAAVTDGERFSVGYSSGFAYPPGCALPAVRDRKPIGELFDRFWSEHRGEAAALPSARTGGNVGKLTLGVLTRSEYARHAVLCALIAFLHPDLYGVAA